MAFHSKILLSVGAPETPAGGSSWSFLKSRMRRRRAGVDIVWLLWEVRSCVLVGLLDEFLFWGILEENLV